MNIMKVDKKIQIVNALVEGNSMRSEQVKWKMNREGELEGEKSDLYSSMSRTCSSRKLNKTFHDKSRYSLFRYSLSLPSLTELISQPTTRGLRCVRPVNALQWMLTNLSISLH